MVREGIRTDDRIFIVILDALCKPGMTNEVKCIFDSMIEMDVKPGVVTYSSLINGYCLQNQMDDAAIIFYLMTQGNPILLL